MGDPDFWDELAPYHATLEDNYLDRSSVRRIARRLRSPVLVVGAGQGLLVAELREHGLGCDGVDRSPEMIRYAALRRGLALQCADARAMPFADGAYRTLVYATGVIDCMADEEDIRAILNEGRRVVSRGGDLFIAFYRMSAALTRFLARVGLLRGNVLYAREALRLYTQDPLRVTVSVAERARTNLLGASIELLRVWTTSPRREKTISARMRRIVTSMHRPESLIAATPERQPYRDEVEIRNMLERLAIPLRGVERFEGCHVVWI
jgi:hypothetical protein